MSSAGAKSLLYGIARANYLIGLPEVIAEEVFKNSRKLLIEQIEQINSKLGTLKRMLGEVHVPDLPDVSAIEENIRTRLDDVGVEVIKTPFTADQAHAAGWRVLNEKPPNGPKNQQFKDSAIWEALKQFAFSNPVIFLTEDKAFFENKDPKLGLESSLKLESDTTKYGITAYYGYSPLLETLNLQEPDISEDGIARELSDIVSEEIRMSYQHLLLENLIDTEEQSFDFFLTEKSGLLTVEFEMHFEAPETDDLESGEVFDLHLVVFGSASWNVSSKETSNVTIDSITEFRNDGDVESHRKYIHMASGSTGKKRIQKHRIKKRIGDAP